ncbi:MAG: hydroxyacylglutathione hydrolase C-terminal domain-containing protein, partial [Pseudomonadota bacterium]
DIPGHTKGHIAYAFCADKALFSGDTIFVLGCGRMFEGTARQMWQSLLKLRALDDDMRVFCAHEYSEENARFATALEPHNRQIQIRAQHIRVLRNQGKATIPSLLGEEKQTNPFLRADDPDLAALIGMASRPAYECFGELRKRKDQF